MKINAIEKKDMISKEMVYPLVREKIEININLKSDGDNHMIPRVFIVMIQEERVHEKNIKRKTPIIFLMNQIVCLLMTTKTTFPRNSIKKERKSEKATIIDEKNERDGGVNIEKIIVLLRTHLT